jgi:hypothetical protein
MHLPACAGRLLEEATTSVAASLPYVICSDWFIHIVHFILTISTLQTNHRISCQHQYGVFNQHNFTASTMEQGDTSTPSPKSKENNPLESTRLINKGKATTALDHQHGATSETSSPVRQPEASGSSHGKQVLSHAIKSLVPHSTRSTLGNKSKNHPRSPLPPTFRAQSTGTTPALAMSVDRLMEAHVFHSRQAIVYLDELVRRRNPAPPAWTPPNDWIVSNTPEGAPSTSTDAEQPRLRDVGSLASVDEEPLSTESSQETRKDSAFTQGMRESIASAGSRGSAFKLGRGTRQTRLVKFQATPE